MRVHRAQIRNFWICVLAYRTGTVADLQSSSVEAWLRLAEPHIAAGGCSLAPLFTRTRGCVFMGDHMGHP